MAGQYLAVNYQIGRTRPLDQKRGQSWLARDVRRHEDGPDV